MTVRRRLAVVAVAVAVVAAAVVVWRCGATPAARSRPRLPARAVPRLDVQRFRDQLAQHRRAAQAVAARYRRDAGAAIPVDQLVIRTLVEPRCILGPAELCALLADSVAACADGDARACLAVGQYLEDTPPRPMAVVFYYLRGCKLGDAEACARIEKPADGEVIDCDRDLMRCAFQARHDRDLVRLDDVCARGVADVCSVLADEYADQPAQARGYLTAGCQLGSPMMCAELGRRLAPGCTGTCYPPDVEQAAAAQTLACEAGFADACAGL